MTSTTCRENKARTEVPEECCENGGLGALDDDRRDTFMTRSPVRVRFYRSTTENWHENKNPAHGSNPVFNGRFHEKVIKVNAESVRLVDSRGRMPDRGNQEESRQLTIVTGERIPVVDDEPQYSENVCQGMGYESLVAHNGFEALSRMTEHLPDFVISDM
jgi:hypothetical protein